MNAHGRTSAGEFLQAFRSRTCPGSVNGSDPAAGAGPAGHAWPCASNSWRDAGGRRGSVCLRWPSRADRPDRPMTSDGLFRNSSPGARRFARLEICRRAGRATRGVLPAPGSLEQQDQPDGASSRSADRPGRRSTVHRAAVSGATPVRPNRRLGSISVRRWFASDTAEARETRRAAHDGGVEGAKGGVPARRRSATLELDGALAWKPNELRLSQRVIQLAGISRFDDRSGRPDRSAGSSMRSEHCYIRADGLSFSALDGSNCRRPQGFEAVSVPGQTPCTADLSMLKRSSPEVLSQQMFHVEHNCAKSR